MPVEVRHSPPPLHQPGDVTKRPKGILKNPSFSGPSGPSHSQVSPQKPDFDTASADITNIRQNSIFSPENSKDLTLQNTLQNAGHRRSSSAARRSSASRRHSAVQGGTMTEDDPEGMRLKWDEANLYLAEQDRGSRMKITEPKTPFQHGNQGDMDEAEEEEDDVAIDPRFVNVDEVEMARAKGRASGSMKRDSEIAPLELGEPEEDVALGGDDVESARIVRGGNLSRESSKEKHVSVSSASGEGIDGVDGEKPGMPTKEEMEKHREFEERRKKHYEMKNMKGLLGHFDEMDEDDDSSAAAGSSVSATLPSRGVNGA